MSRSADPLDYFVKQDKIGELSASLPPSLLSRSAALALGPRLGFRRRATAPTTFAARVFGPRSHHRQTPRGLAIRRMGRTSPHTLFRASTGPANSLPLALRRPVPPRDVLVHAGTHARHLIRRRRTSPSTVFSSLCLAFALPISEPDMKHSAVARTLADLFPPCRQGIVRRGLQGLCDPNTEGCCHQK